MRTVVVVLLLAGGVAAADVTVGPSIALDNSATAGAVRPPLAAFDGTDYVVVWSGVENSSTFGVWDVRVSTAGIVVDSSPVLIAGDPSGSLLSMAAAGTTGGALALWTVNTTGEAFAAVVAGGSATSKVDLGYAPVPNALHAVGTDGGFLVVGQRSDASLVAQRIALDGTLLDTTPVATGTSTFLGLACNGAKCLLTSALDVQAVGAQVIDTSSSLSIGTASTLIPVRASYYGEIADGARWIVSYADTSGDRVLFDDAAGGMSTIDASITGRLVWDGAIAGLTASAVLDRFDATGAPIDQTPLPFTPTSIASSTKGTDLIAYHASTGGEIAALLAVSTSQAGGPDAGASGSPDAGATPGTTSHGGGCAIGGGGEPPWLGLALISIVLARTRWRRRLRSERRAHVAVGRLVARFPMIAFDHPRKDSR
jgi:hypothetical protein